MAKSFIDDVFGSQDRDTFYNYTKKYLSQRPELSYYDAQGYTEQVDQFYTAVYNAHGGLTGIEDNQYTELMALINSKVTENPVPIVPVGLNPPDGIINQVANIPLPDFQSIENQVKGFLIIGGVVIGSGLLFYMYLKFKK